MPKHGGSSVGFLLVGGYNLLAAKLQSLPFKIEALTEQSDGLGDAWDEHTPTGNKKVTFSQEGAFFSTETGGIHNGLQEDNPANTSRVICVGLAGNVTGKIFAAMQGSLKVAYEVVAQLKKLTRANAAYAVSGKAEYGVVLWPHSVTAANGSSGASDHYSEEGQRAIPIVSSSVAADTVITTSVPHGLVTGETIAITDHVGSTPALASSGFEVTVLSPTTFSIPVGVSVGGTGGYLSVGRTARGGTGYAQVEILGLGGYDALRLKIRDSDDDVTYADLITFADFIAGKQYEAVELPAAGVVGRYTLATHTYVGAGSGQSSKHFVGFARNQ